jgi:hypothetical protein
MFKIKIADLTVAFDNKYSYVEALCRPYFSDEEPDFTLSATDEEIEREAKKLSVSPDYGESVALCSHLADRLYLYDAFLAHGAVLQQADNAYLISADSGVGKTTHVHLWKRVYGDEVGILNGDKPIIRKKDGVFFAEASPWRGKEREGGKGSARLRAVCFLERAEQNSAERISPSLAASELIRHIYMPRDGAAMMKTLALVDELSRELTAVKLSVNMDESAARVAREFIEENIKKDN